MSSSLLKWIANGVIAVVLTSTLWLAQAVRQPGEPGPSLMLAQVAAPAASAPAATIAR